jgi:hypothetical protein
MRLIKISECQYIMTTKNTGELQDEPESDLPPGLSKPAQRALAGAGYARLEQFTKVRQAEVLKLHGMGPKGMEMLRRALAAKGMSFADDSER